MRQKVCALALAASLASGTAWAADVSSVADGKVSIRPGEAFEIVFPDRNDLSHPQFSRVIDHVDDNVKGFREPPADAPPPTGPALMSFEFKKDGDMLVLLIRNDTGVKIKYSATMTVSTSRGDRSAHTSICPSFPGMMGSERWMDPIATLELSDFRPADPNSFTCD
ncbi:MAG TPA: hypothetical protein VG889_00030 [Rhizomicrobium sp.]|nr:hypothetical protein [Rhizomicrobium sp.]